MNNFLWYSHFSGGGGSTLGAKAAGFTVLGGIEFDSQIAQLYKKNIGDILVKDIRNVNPYMLDIPSPQERQIFNQILIIQTSPPCQEFSLANTKRDLRSASATIIKETYSHYQTFQPEYIILENVPPYEKSKAYRDFENFLISQNYRVLKFVLNAADFGVPQSRHRLIAIAIKEGRPIPIIEPTHGKSQSNQLSLFEKPKQPWLGWYEAIANLIDDLPKSSLTEKQQAVASKLTSTKALLVERVGYYQNPKIVDSTSPCWTLRACLSSDGKNGSRSKIIDAVVGADIRSLNVAALARLQSFPDNYQWSGTMKTDVRAIGNSVPPLLMQKICQAIKDCFN